MFIDELDNGIFNTNNPISYYYPSIDVTTYNGKPNIKNIDFVKNKLFKFIEKDDKTIFLTYLVNENTYLLEEYENNQDKTNISKLNELLPTVSNYETWSNFIDSIETYYELNNLLYRLNQVFDNLYQIDLLNNSIDTIDSYGLFRSVWSNQVSFSSIYILIYISLFLTTSFLIFSKNNKKK